MKNQIRAAIAIIIGTAFLVPAVTLAANQNRVMTRLLDTVAKQSLKGYTRPNNAIPRMGTLDEGNQIAIPIKLSKGKKYGFAAVCDASCNDIDLSLKDANGEEIGVDNGEQETAVVKYTADKTGQYYLAVDMASCNEAECAYGVGLYRK